MVWRFHMSLLHLYVPSRALRSQDTGLVKVPKVRRKAVGERAVSSSLWNSLPGLQQACCVEVFKAKLILFFLVLWLSPFV